MISILFASLFWTQVRAVTPVETQRLETLIEEHFKRSTAVGASWGVQIVDIPSGRTVWGTNEHKLFIPASVSKLFTAAAALNRWGPDHTFFTEIRRTGSIDPGGTLKGDLIVVGGGAPGFGDRNTSSFNRAFDPILKAVQNQGIRTIEGRLRLATARCPSIPYGSGWNWDDLQEGYGAPVGPFIALDNAIWVHVRGGTQPGAPGAIETPLLPGIFDVINRVWTIEGDKSGRIRFLRLPGSTRLEVEGSVGVGRTHSERMAVPDGAEWFARGLQEAMQSAELMSRQAPAATIESDPQLLVSGSAITRVSSPPLGQVLAETLKTSNNLLAHLLILQLGWEGIEQRRQTPGTLQSALDAETLGLEAVHRFARVAGVPAGEFIMEEGSGLSRKNLVTPHGVIRLILAMERHAQAETWRKALPVGGVDGTLRTRFSKENVRGRLRAKTGTLRHVNALAGVLDTRDGRQLAFAVFVNGYLDAAGRTSGAAEMDGLVELLLEYEGVWPR